MQSTIAASIGPAEAAEALRSGRARLVDVRERDEYQHERIDGSTLLPLANVDRAALPKDAAVTWIVNCRSGRRSADAVRRLRSQGELRAVSLAGGIEAWKAAGFAVIRDTSAPMPVMRQVQLTIGVLLLVSVALAAFVSPWFLVVPAVLGTGLTFAGATGWCGLAMLLGAMPWNRDMGACSNCSSS